MTLWCLELSLPLIWLYVCSMSTYPLHPSCLPVSKLVRNRPTHHWLIADPAGDLVNEWLLVFRSCKMCNSYKFVCRARSHPTDCSSSNNPLFICVLSKQDTGQKRLDASMPMTHHSTPPPPTPPTDYGHAGERTELYTRDRRTSPL